jgi:hypothetical protein
MQQLNRNIRSVLDYLCMTKNAQASAQLRLNGFTEGNHQQDIDRQRHFWHSRFSGMQVLIFSAILLSTIPEIRLEEVKDAWRLDNPNIGVINRQKRGLCRSPHTGVCMTTLCMLAFNSIRLPRGNGID